MQHEQTTRQDYANGVGNKRNTAAIVIEGSAEAQGKIMYCAKKIDLAGIGIKNIKIRKRRTGATILEMEGNSSDEKADMLTKQLLEVGKEHEEVKIRRPCRVIKLRIRGVESTVTREEMIAAIEGKWDRPLSRHLADNIVVGRPKAFWGDCPWYGSNVRRRWRKS